MKTDPGGLCVSCYLMHSREHNSRAYFGGSGCCGERKGNVFRRGMGSPLKCKMVATGRRLGKKNSPVEATTGRTDQREGFRTRLAVKTNFADEVVNESEGDEC